MIISTVLGLEFVSLILCKIHTLLPQDAVTLAQLAWT
jgi:hypothetical protein